MIKDPKSLLISIVIHILVLTLTLYIWDNYVRTQNKQLDTKVKLTPPITKDTKKDIVPLTEEIQKQTKPEPIQEVNEKPIVETPVVKTINIPVKEKQVVKKVQKQKIVKKYNLEPKKVGDFLVEQVPEELIYIRKNETSKNKTAQKNITKAKLKKQRQKEQKLKEQKSESKRIEEHKSYAKIYLKTNKKIIFKLLKKNLFHPSSLKKKGFTGEIIVKFKLNANKKIYDIKVVESSNKMLNSIAMKTISNLSTKLPRPKRDIVLHLPVEYKLN